MHEDILNTKQTYAKCIYVVKKEKRRLN